MATTKKAAQPTTSEEPDAKVVAKALADAKATIPQCAYGNGHYTAPKDEPRCTRKADRSDPKRPKAVLCKQHEATYCANLKARAASAKPKVAQAQPAKPTKPASERKAPAPARKPIQRVPFAEPQPAVVQLVPPTK